ncbi:ATP-binding protein [Candidatus Uhrbacteria bacterium]|nr:ATP-binding protein [Candidatus Uhrbacteria bacterium]
MQKRYIEGAMRADIEHKKMVFLAGPRQVGKTTLARDFARRHFPSVQYLNWDNAEHRRIIRTSYIREDADVVIFDELHKYERWKRYLKGFYDVDDGRHAIIVTGSARLDVYRRGGDSMQGRYHLFRLHPFSYAEVKKIMPSVKPFQPLVFHSASRDPILLAALLRYGGFPEPFLSQDEDRARRWRVERLERLVREDIRDLEHVHSLSTIEHLIDLLPEKVQSLLSLNGLREDLEVSHASITLWMDILERMYYHYRLYPFSHKKIRSLKKEAKLYLWDWSEVVTPSAREENIIASHLLKFAHYLRDTAGYQADLWYLRDRDGREVDFLMTVDGRPWFAVEVKHRDCTISNHLRYFAERIGIPFLYQVVFNDDVYSKKEGIVVVSADRFLSAFV